MPAALDTDPMRRPLAIQAADILAQFSPAQRAAGALAFSSSNHAQAIALSGRLLGIPTVIVMPQDGPAAKLAAAAVLEGVVDLKGARVGVLLSGGNVDLPVYAPLLAKA